LRLSSAFFTTFLMSKIYIIEFVFTCRNSPLFRSMFYPLPRTMQVQGDRWPEAAWAGWLWLVAQPVAQSALPVGVGRQRAGRMAVLQGRVASEKRFVSMPCAALSAGRVRTLEEGVRQPRSNTPGLLSSFLKKSSGLVLACVCVLNHLLSGSFTVSRPVLLVSGCKVACAVSEVLNGSIMAPQAPKPFILEL
jgi:hypothetical protein